MLWSLTDQEIPGSEDLLPERPNPHCLDRLIQAAPVRELIACEDIRDQRGVLLWARGQAVDSGIRERLIARRLLRPLESSLTFRDTLGAMEVLACARRVLDEHPAVARLLGPDSQQVLAILGQARLLKGPGMLLTALAQERPAALAHAALVAMINIWLAIGLGRGEGGLLDAAESGLMHDLGEFYLAPEVLHPPAGRMSFDAWRALSVHPVVGCALVREAGGVYDEALAVAIREHHERVDGSGYPAGSGAISPLGRLLLCAEVLATLLAGSDHVLVRARIALQMIPGQFPREVVGLVAARLRLLPHDPPGEVDPAALQITVSDVLYRLERVSAAADALRAGDLEPSDRQLLGRLSEQVARYTMAMHDCGAHALVGKHDWLQADPQAADEVFRVAREMAWQLPGLHRHVELMVRSRATQPGRWQPLLDAFDAGAGAG